MSRQSNSHNGSLQMIPAIIARKVNYDALDQERPPHRLRAPTACIVPNPSYAWDAERSPVDALLSVKMGTFREFQLYMVC